MGAAHPAVSKRAADKLRAEFPLFEGVLEAAGPLPTPAELERLAAERAALAERLERLKRRIAELRAAEKRK